MKSIFEEYSKSILKNVESFSKMLLDLWFKSSQSQLYICIKNDLPSFKVVTYANPVYLSCTNRV